MRIGIDFVLTKTILKKWNNKNNTKLFNKKQLAIFKTEAQQAVFIF